MVSFVLWYLCITALGWLAFPIAFRLLPALSDRGLAFSRALGWLLWGFVFWLLASLGILRNTPGGLLLAFIPIAVLSVWVWRSLSRSPGQAHPLLAWLGANRRLVLMIELLFLAAFAWMAFIRAANPEAAGTEKPMELAFINAILRSPTFPPHDPWLSGYAISYYYFGYVLAAMLAKLTGTLGAVAFNLTLSLVFALAALGAYGIVYNLLSLRFKPAPIPSEHGRETSPASLPPTPPGEAELLQSGPLRSPVIKEKSGLGTVAALLGPLFVLFVSNLEGFLHSLHTRGLFWQGQNSSFWKWLDIVDLNLPPSPPYSWVPQRFWWWWRASRVVQDFDLAGNSKGDIIDEFPAFSFLLGDLHPHVLAIPFAFLALALALNLFLGGGRSQPEGLRLRLPARNLAWFSLLLAAGGLIGIAASATIQRSGLGLAGLVGLLAGGAFFAALSTSSDASGHGLFLSSQKGRISIGPPLYMNGSFFLLAAVVLGGLAFLNTWDFPVYTALVAAAYALNRVFLERRAAEAVGESSSGGRSASFAAFARDIIWSSLALGLVGGLLYLPFYLGFASQAGGIIPNLIYATRGAHLWVMFGSLWIPIFAYLLFLWKEQRDLKSLGGGLLAAFGFTLLLWLLAMFLSGAVLAFGNRFFPGLRDLYLSIHAAADVPALILGGIQRRLINIGGWLTLVLLLGAVLGLLYSLIWKERAIELRAAGNPDVQPGSLAQTSSSSPQGVDDFTTVVIDSRRLADPFALLLILFGTFMVLGPEFFYLRDVFGTRINTIFKFYYQAWLLWAAAAAFAAAVLLRVLRGGWRVAFTILLILVLMTGLVYPIFGIWSKTNGLKPEVWTLDGSAFFARGSPDEMAAIEWLRQAPLGVVAVAVSPHGGSYTEYASAATFSGQPAVLGWTGHESQWRGGGAEMGTRQVDMERLYCSSDWREAKEILDRYSVRYVYVGGLERSTYVPGQGAACRTGLSEEKFDTYLNPVFRQGGVAVYEYTPAVP